METVEVKKCIAVKHVALGAYNHPRLLVVKRIVEAGFPAEHLHLVQDIVLGLLPARNINDKHQSSRAVGVPENTSTHGLVFVSSWGDARQVANTDLQTISESDDADVRPCGAELLRTNTRVRTAHGCKQRCLSSVGFADQSHIIEYPQLELQPPSLARRAAAAVSLLEGHGPNSACATLANDKGVLMPEQLVPELWNKYPTPLLCTFA
mmetsp:Transcript_67445/g.121541  ORF Transcript_67445/g.121541 Transcript_67445/m.121541 type:complete len:208 (-) Transcript_67445:64-687(-)